MHIAINELLLYPQAMLTCMSLLWDTPDMLLV